MAEFVRGMQLEMQQATGIITIHWKQANILGIKGHRSQTYYIYTYETPQGTKVPVYIQDGYNGPDKMVCNKKLQCGMNDGVFFLVYHDQEQKPFQHLFVLEHTLKMLYQGNDWLKSMGVRDFSWITGDYLRDF